MPVGAGTELSCTNNSAMILVAARSSSIVFRSREASSLSSSIAPELGSCSKSRTAPRPAHALSAAGSPPVSSSTGCSLSTAFEPSRRATGMISATAPDATWPSPTNSHRSIATAAIAGNPAIQSRPASPEYFSCNSASSAGTMISPSTDTTTSVLESLAVRSTGGLSRTCSRFRALVRTRKVVLCPAGKGDQSIIDRSVSSCPISEQRDVASKRPSGDLNGYPSSASITATSSGFASNASSMSSTNVCTRVRVSRRATTISAVRSSGAGRAIWGSGSWLHAHVDCCLGERQTIKILPAQLEFTSPDFISVIDDHCSVFSVVA
jgi:hypothetical protein